MAFKIVTTAFFALILLLFVHPFEGNGDFFHHINTGRFIATNFSLPRTDVFTYTAQREPWIAHSWASGLLFYFIFTTFGEFGVSVFVALVAVLLFGLLFYLLRSYGISRKATLLTIALVAPIISTRWPQRPEILLYPFITTLLIIDQKKAQHPKVIFLFPVIIWLWSIFYGSSVILGLGILGLLIGKQLVADKFKLTKSSLRFYLLAIAALVISYFNGYGWDTIFYILKYIPKVSTYEGEWLGLIGILNLMPVQFLLTLQYHILLYFGLIAIVILLIFSAWRPILKQPFTILLAFGILLPFNSFRQLPTAALLSAPLLGVAINRLIKENGFRVLVLLLAVIFYSLAFWLRPPQMSVSSNSDLKELVNFVKSHQIAGQAFNQNNLGALLTYYLYPEVKVFFDTRDEVFVNTHVTDDIMSFSDSPKALIPILDKYKSDLVFADMQDGFNYQELFYSKNWQVVFMNNRYILALRSEIAHSKSLNSIAYVDPYSDTASKPGQEENAVRFYKERLESTPDSVSYRLLLASILLSLNKYSEVIEDISKLDIDNS